MVLSLHSTSFNKTSLNDSHQAFPYFTNFPSFSFSIHNSLAPCYHTNSLLQWCQNHTAANLYAYNFNRKRNYAQAKKWRIAVQHDTYKHTHMQIPHIPSPLVDGTLRAINTEWMEP